MGLAEALKPPAALTTSAATDSAPSVTKQGAPKCLASKHHPPQFPKRLADRRSQPIVWEPMLPMPNATYDDYNVKLRKAFTYITRDKSHLRDERGSVTEHTFINTVTLDETRSPRFTRSTFEVIIEYVCKGHIDGKRPFWIRYLQTNR